MGQKQSHPLADNEIDMMNRTDLSSHFSNTMSKSYEPDECIHCGAILEENNLFNSGGGKSSVVISPVQCRECRICQTPNVILVKFRQITGTSSPRSFCIRTTINAQSKPFRLDDNHNTMLGRDIVTERSRNGADSTSV